MTVFLEEKKEEKKEEEKKEEQKPAQPQKSDWEEFQEKRNKEAFDEELLRINRR